MTHPPAADETTRPVLLAAVMLIVGSAVAVDPWGWAPYGPLRWTLISSITLIVAALALRLDSIEVHKPSALGWLAFLLWGIVASVAALDPLYTWIGTPDRHLGLLTAALVALMFFAGQQLSTPTAITGLLRAAIVALATIGGYTLLELFDVAPVGLATASGRPGGPYGTAAYLGAACALLIPITIGAALAEVEAARWRYLAYASAGLGVVAALASQTRAGWVGLIAAAVVTLVVQGRWLRRNWPAVATVVALLAIVAVISPVGSRVTSAFDFGDGTARGRLDEWQVGAAVAVKHPITGVGFEGYRIAFAEGVDADYERRYTRQTMPDRAHNGPLDVAVTTGLPGMALYLAGAGFLLLRAARALLSGRSALAGLGAGVIGYLAQQWFLFPIAEVDPVFWLFAGVLVAGTSTRPRVRLSAPRWAWAMVATLAGVAVLAGSLNVVADHHVSDGLEHLAQGDPAGALASTDLAAAIRPDSIRYYVIAAAVAASPRSGDGYRWAVDRLDKALELSPRDPILLAEHAAYNLRLAQAARDVTTLQAAIGEWEALVMEDPVHARYRLELGNGYAIAGNNAGAEEQWLAAADLAPRSTTPLTNLATLYIEDDRLDEAAEVLAGTFDRPHRARDRPAGRANSTLIAGTGSSATASVVLKAQEGSLDRDRDPTQLTPQDPEPRWESDLADREARRRKMLVFGGTTAAVLLGFVGLYAGLSWVAGGLTTDPTPEDRGLRPSGAGAAVASEAVAPSIDAVVAPVASTDDLDWYAIEAPLGHSQRLFATSTGAFYALSTAPGQTISWPPPRAVYKSGDGENWEIITLDNDNSANDMAASRGALYLIGTAPGTGSFDEPAAVVVSASQDEGDIWSTTLLPTVAAPPGGAAIEWSNVTTRIAASDDAVVAAVHSQFYLDYRQLVPPEFAGDYGYNPRADGVDVIDHRLMEQMYMTCEREMGATGGDLSGISEECRRLFEEGDESVGSIAFVTWEEMGLPEGGEPMFSEMFVSADGSTFDAVESPFTAGSEVSGLFALPDGFIGVESERGRTALWRSDDGRSWHQDTGIPNFTWVTNVGAVDGRAVVIGQGFQEDSMVAWEDDAGGWEVVNFDELLGPMPANGGRWLSSAGVGPMGVVVVFQSFDERTEREVTQVALGASPEDWSLIPIDEITGMSGGYSNWVAVGVDRILVKYDVYTEFRQLSLQVMGVSTN